MLCGRIATLRPMIPKGGFIRRVKHRYRISYPCHQGTVGRLDVIRERAESQSERLADETCSSGGHVIGYALKHRVAIETWRCLPQGFHCVNCEVGGPSHQLLIGDSDNA
ncbi:MAG: hypothetical protein QOH66_2842, partial [Actinomycetota bacterium]|nr:hypothetical protein [Actinomycetota bacterium]